MEFDNLHWINLIIFYSDLKNITISAGVKLKFSTIKPII